MVECFAFKPQHQTRAKEIYGVLPIDLDVSHKQLFIKVKGTVVLKYRMQMVHAKTFHCCWTFPAPAVWRIRGDKVIVDKHVLCLCFHLYTAGATPVCMQLCHMLPTWEDWNTHLAKSGFAQSTKERQCLCPYEEQIESFPPYSVERYCIKVDSRARPSIPKSTDFCKD